MSENHNDIETESPPFFKHWSGVYWLVIGTLAVLVLLFHLFTVYFS